MDYREIEAYLTHYQPERKAQLLREQSLQAYLDQQVTAMRETRLQIITELSQHSPRVSQFQREIEAEHIVRQLFFPLR